MRVKKENLKDLRKILRGIDYFPVGGEAYIAFPIDMSEDTKEVAGFELKVTASNVSKEDSVPAIMLWDDEDSPTVLAYINPASTVDFNIVQYADLMNAGLSKKERKFLSDIDACLVYKKGVFGCFEFERKKKK